MRKCFTAMAFLFLSGCSHTVNLNSVPTGVEVYSLDKQAKRRALLGVTPLVLPSATKAEDFHYIELSKPGYLPQVTIIPFASALDANAQYRFVLKKQDAEWFRIAMRGVFIRELDNVLGQFVELHENIFLDNESECRRLISAMSKQYGNISSFHLLSGAFYWKKNDLEEAKTSYVNALKLNPRDAEALTMLRNIDVLLGM